jgi:hypothetical protein
MYLAITAAFALAGFLLAQGPAAESPGEPLLQYAGQPMRVPFHCTGEDIQLFGMTCTERSPCPIYLELVRVEPVGTKIFVTGNFHSDASTLSSILLASDDGGKTWFEPFGRIRGAGLEQIQFLDFETGWISGQMLGALPRDPFFLVTTDGGKNWRRRPIFSESRVGAIELFWFESRTSGGLLIDRIQPGETGARHELYETMTGGESWMIRQVSSTPIRPKGKPAAPNPGWRLRPDGATKSYHIERRQGQNWQTVAAFLIHTGDCLPEEEPLPEPPAVEEPLVAPGGVFSPSAPKPPRKPPSLKKPRP